MYIYIYMYVCMYVCMYIYIYVYMICWLFPDHEHGPSMDGRTHGSVGFHGTPTIF